MTQNGIPNAQHGQRRRRFANRYQARLPGDYNITNYPRATRCGSPHSRFSAVARFQSCWIPKRRTKDDAARMPAAVFATRANRNLPHILIRIFFYAPAER